MSKILISVKPMYGEAILHGEKKFEFRTRVASQKVESLILYETAPVKAVVGEVAVLSVLSCSPSEMWEKTKEHGGITKQAFFTYFKGRKVAYAYVLGPAHAYGEKICLSHYGINQAPQSYRYL